MKVGMFGLGKLGLPVSVAMVLQGKHEVYGYDTDDVKRTDFKIGHCNYYEPDIEKLLPEALGKGLHIVDSPVEAVKDMDIVFIAVPTPSKYDNSFDLSYLEEAVYTIGQNLSENQYTLVTVISTILPGTMRATVESALRSATSMSRAGWGLCYNASFIAMGTTIGDFLSPEFVLIGESDKQAGRLLEKFYESIVDKWIPRCHMTWENAEMVKMCYNTMIGYKIIIANTIMEMASKLETGDCDIVSRTLGYANKRIVSDKYLRGGMGDGGACHPRDQLALSYLAHELDLAHDPFGMIMSAREKQAEYLANMMCEWKGEHSRPLVIMGIRYKSNTNLSDYSAALLVRDLLIRKGQHPRMYDPKSLYQPDQHHLSDPPKKLSEEDSVFLIAIEDDFVHNLDQYPEHSVIIDPWRCFSSQEIGTLKEKSVDYVPVGRCQ